MLNVQVSGCPIQRTVVIGQSVLDHSINTPFESVGEWGLLLRTDEGTLLAHAEIQSAVESYSQSSNPYPSCMHNGSIRPRTSFQNISMVSLIRHPKALYQPSHPSPIIVSSFSGYPPFPVSYRSSSQDRTCSSVWHHSVPPQLASAVPQAPSSSNLGYSWCQESSISIQVHYAPSWEVTTAGVVDLRNQHGHS